MVDIDHEMVPLTEQLAAASPDADDLAVARRELRAVTNQIHKGSNPLHISQTLALENISYARAG